MLLSFVWSFIMLTMRIGYLILFAIWLPYIRTRLTCSNVAQEPRPEFHMVAPCSASGMSIIARTNTTSLKRCSQFANLKRGLAFNFAKPGRKRTTPENCLIYDCPEYDILQSIRRERDFDYYSLYSDPLPTENTTCVIGVGMFRIFEKRANYMDAMEICRQEGGELANVLTAARTNGLSNMVSSLNERKAYVGMDDIQHEGRFMTVSGKLLTCFEYRAWAPGEPRSRRKTDDCVVIDGQRGWKVVSCSRKLPFICELLPKGPFPIPDDDNVNRCDIDLSNRKIYRRVSVNRNFHKKSLIFQWLSASFTL